MKYVPCCMKFSCMCISLRSEVRWNPINLPWSIFQKLIDQLSVWTPCPHFFSTFLASVHLDKSKQFPKRKRGEEIWLQLYPAGIPAPSRASSIADKCPSFKPLPAWPRHLSTQLAVISLQMAELELGRIQQHNSSKKEPLQLATNVLFWPHYSSTFQKKTLVGIQTFLCKTTTTRCAT